MKTAKGHGLFLSIILNMLFRTWWLSLVTILIILHFVLGWPLWLMAIPIACWILHAVIITLVLGWANASVDTTAEKEKKNINPYSSKNSDYMKEQK